MHFFLKKMECTFWSK